MRLKRFVLGIVLVFLTSAVSFAGGVIKIGFFAPLTGFAAADGASAKHGAMLAVEKINSTGGILGKKVKLVVYDDGVSSQQAVAIARKLIQQDRVVGVVSGSYSTPTRAAAPIYQRFRVPFVVAYATHPDITKAGDYVFRVGFLAKVEGRAGGYVATTMLHAKKIAVLTMDNDFGKALSEGFVNEAKKNGAEVVANLSFALGEKDMTPYLTKIKALNPDLIYCTGYYSEGALTVKQAKQLGIKAQLFGQEGFDSPMFLKIAGNAANGTIITTDLNRDSKRPIVKWFISQYRKQFKMEPDMVGASSFDAVYVLAEAIKKANSTNPARIRKALASIKNFNGVTGKIHGFTKKGEVIKPVVLQKVEDGKFIYFGVVDKKNIITP
ncbi:ABC transporter substrate-binding protein [Hippea maritima]|uniref:Extracellular ligand-binding receptor n=1 Tax=Hippea maritima (strain ATCC 700847 / DSM 10411 / MH2) TaxID=760142 RepID=F2LUI5_HIPMA|nr:ABC transporter substrate-binding protein [Hippea maritima]AEA34575.1 Extracellular ligand-binding receptor [Hippea maritima DSM 10411]